MNYELAKQLKEAGFPQQSYFVYSPSGMEVPKHLAPLAPCTSKPTLEELIEACGYKFSTLWAYEDDIAGKEVWSANCKYDYGKYVGIGDIPSEAVAKLWLELQK